MVLVSLSSRPSTEPNQHPIRTFPNPGPVRLTEWHTLSDSLTTSPSAPPSASPSCFPTKIRLIPPAGGRSKISNQIFFWVPQPRSSQKISNQPSLQISHLGSIEISNQTLIHITQLGSIPIFHRKPPCPDPSSHPIAAKKNPIITPQLHSFYKNIPR